MRVLILFPCFSVVVVFVVVVVVVDVAVVVVVVAVFPQLNSGGSPSIYNCALTNLFHRVGGLRVLSLKKKKKKMITPPHGQPHAAVGRFISISGGWLL